MEEKQQRFEMIRQLCGIKRAIYSVTVAIVASPLLWVAVVRMDEYFDIDVILASAGIFIAFIVFAPMVGVAAAGIVNCFRKR